MITLQNVTKCYGDKKALDEVSLQIGKGEIIGLFGENGAGKTTLLKSILNLVPYQGSITLNGEEITRKNIQDLSFATCEHSFFPGLTAEEHADFYNRHFSAFRKKRYEGLMQFFELPVHKPLRHFSTGQQNQFEVIMALSQGAEYILMDEPFSGNDVFNREDFYKVLMGILEPEETVILSTHLIEEVESFIGRAVLIHSGKLIGDRRTEELEEEGRSLLTYVKETYGYRHDRVGRAIRSLTEEDNHA